MNSHDPIGESYVQLGLRINRHLEGYVDSYCGPPEWKAQIETESPRAVGALLDDAAALRDQISQADLDAQRHDFLTRQVVAMDTVLKQSSGAELSLLQEVRGCFDITPQRVPETLFEAALRELDELLPGTGDLTTRLVAWKRQLELPQERILPVLEVALAEVRRRTLSMLELPADESVELRLVSDQPWSGYNRYLGHNRSRIEVNTDLPVRADQVVNLMAHETYPGHHTELVSKEERWYRRAGRLEHSIQLLLAPECVISEGLATVAEEVIFPDQEELATWLRHVLYPAAGIRADVDQQLRLARAAEKLDGVSGNAAFLLHEERRSEDEVLEYIHRYSLRTDKEARQTLRFIGNPLFRSYIFTYFYGRRLLKQAGTTSSLWDVFRWVIHEPITPTAIVVRYCLSSEPTLA
jgi:hypothetical protein